MVQKNPNRYEWRMPLELLFLGQERYEVTRLKGEGTTTTLCPKIETEPFRMIKKKKCFRWKNQRKYHIDFLSPNF